MGHEDIETTMIYVHMVESQKHGAARATGAFKRNCHKITTEGCLKAIDTFRIGQVVIDILIEWT